MAHEDLGLGKIITETRYRDAIHVPVAPVVAGQRLKPGEHVGIAHDGTACLGIEAVGVVDPFLREPVELGQTFWLLLYPGTISYIRHMWSHPAFRPKAPRALT